MEKKRNILKASALVGLVIVVYDFMVMSKPKYVDDAIYVSQAYTVFNIAYVIDMVLCKIAERLGYE